MRSAKVAVAALAMLAGVIAWPASARACDCFLPEIGPFPGDGDVDVPTNTLIWLDWHVTAFEPDSHEVLLLDDQQVEVGLTHHTLTDMLPPEETPIVSLYAPDMELQEHTTYEVRIDGEVEVTFTTGASLDLDAPMIPIETGREGHYFEAQSGDCPESRTVTFELQLEGVVALMDREHESELTLDPLGGAVTQISPDPRLTLGHAPCIHSWPDAPSGGEATVRFGALDVAGNFSGWSGEIDVVMPEDPAGCRCAHHPDDHIPAVLLVLVCPAFAPRRR